MSDVQHIHACRSSQRDTGHPLNIQWFKPGEAEHFAAIKGHGSGVGDRRVRRVIRRRRHSVAQQSHAIDPARAAVEDHGKFGIGQCRIGGHRVATREVDDQRVALIVLAIDRDVFDR